MTIREMASLGGKARAASLTKAQRKAIGKKAIEARWSKIDKSLTEIEKRQPKIKKLLKKAKASKPR